MLQIAFAIMMIFMIAYFMFRTESVRVQEEQIMEIERQKLILAAETVLDAYRGRYGLSVLMPKDAEGVSRFDPALVLPDGASLTEVAPVREAFAQGAAKSFKDYSDPIGLRKTWLGQVLAQAELSEGALGRKNLEWLQERIDTDVQSMREDVRAVQDGCAVRLQRYWMEHPESLDDPATAKLLADFKTADEARRLLLVTDISHALKRHSADRLRALSGADMLP